MVRRLAVALPVSASFASWVSLPPNLDLRSHTARCNAALERAFLRPQDVRARIHQAISLPNGGSMVLLLAAKSTLVDALEEVCRSVALDLTYLLPRPFVVHYAAALWGGRVSIGQVAYVDPSSTGPVLYLFDDDTYRGTFYQLPESAHEMRGAVLTGGSDDRFDQTCQEVSFVINGPQALSAMISDRYGSTCVYPLGSLPGARRIATRHNNLIPYALSVWEKGDR